MSDFNDGLHQLMKGKRQRAENTAKNVRARIEGEAASRETVADAMDRAADFEATLEGSSAAEVGEAAAAAYRKSVAQEKTETITSPAPGR